MNNLLPGRLNQIFARFPIASRLSSVRNIWGRKVVLAGILFLALVVLAVQVSAISFSFSSGAPDGRVVTLSVPSSTGNIQTETADDFVLATNTLISQATFTGLIPSGTPLTAVANVEIEIYHVFPLDSDTNRVLTVPT